MQQAANKPRVAMDQGTAQGPVNFVSASKSSSSWVNVMEAANWSRGFKHFHFVLNPHFCGI
jgi:hypothetical protein